MLDLSDHGKKKLKLFVVVVENGKADNILEIVKEFGVTCKWVMLGRGTADSAILNYFGLGRTDKDIVILPVRAESSKVLMKKLNDNLNLDKRNHGIAFSISISGVGGVKTLGILSGSNDIEIADDIKEGIMDANLEKEILYDLIITIVGRGFADDVITAAKDKGAEGGTVIHARGMGIHETEQFFGISIQPEKEVILTLIPRHLKSGIIKEICDKAGLSTPGKGISFSVPVDDVAGIVHLLKE